MDLGLLIAERDMPNYIVKFEFCLNQSKLFQMLFYLDCYLNSCLFSARTDIIVSQCSAANTGEYSEALSEKVTLARNGLLIKWQSCDHIETRIDLQSKFDNFGV